MPTPYEILILDIDKYYNNDRGRIMIVYTEGVCLSTRQRGEIDRYM